MSDVSHRPATEADLPAIIALLNDDVFGQTRNPLFDAEAVRYRAAFRAIAADPNNFQIVAVQDARIVGCYQLTFIRGLSFSGSERAQIESVRIASELRGSGLGTAMMHDAIARARSRDVVLVQLTTDTRRDNTRRFYERLGFTASHHGMKLRLR
jgi:ribosomal protein S18 acetylase RimI-like enzyme